MVDTRHATSFQSYMDFFFFCDDDVSIEESKDIADGICVFLSGILPTVQRAANAYRGPPKKEPFLLASPARLEQRRYYAPLITGLMKF